MKYIIKNITILTVLLIIAAFISSCKTEESIDCSNYNYSDCYTIKPVVAPLKIDLTINNENPKVVLFIYNGKVEDNNIISIDTLITTSFEKYVNVNNFYSASIEYKYGDKTIKAIDGIKLKTTGTTICDSTCWKITGDKLNLKLR